MSAPRTTRFLALPLIATALLTTDLEAQGRGRGHDDRPDRVVIVQQGTKRPKPRKVRTSDEAVDVTRIVLREQGYQLVRIEQRGDVRVVYYRRGNMGRGRGKGPLMYMIVRPARERILIERAPRGLTAQINIRLGY